MTEYGCTLQIGCERWTDGPDVEWYDSTKVLPPEDGGDVLACVWPGIYGKVTMMIVSAQTVIDDTEDDYPFWTFLPRPHKEVQDAKDKGLHWEDVRR